MSERLTDEQLRDRTGAGWTTEPVMQSMAAELLALRARVAKLEAANEQQQEALWRIQNWSEAYPLDVFLEPDLKKAHEVLTAAGMTLDAISAHAMRHVVRGVGEIARAALKDAPR